MSTETIGAGHWIIIYMGKGNFWAIGPDMGGEMRQYNTRQIIK